uniref:RING-type E3 ubiquitin transferase n=1 Tax=Heterorhabditis bacteriophora TaxID=37862 RepID=A0A1I7WTR8_HETBA
MLLNRGSSIGDDSSNSNDDDMGDEGDERRIRQRLFQLYPRVDVKRFPLPRMWSTSDKFHFLDITHNALRVSYRDIIEFFLTIRHLNINNYVSIVEMGNTNRKTLHLHELMFLSLHTDGVSIHEFAIVMLYKLIQVPIYLFCIVSLFIYFINSFKEAVQTARASVTSEILATELPPEKTEWMNKKELHQGIFEHNKSIALVLKCQEFVEMAAELAKQVSFAIWENYGNIINLSIYIYNISDSHSKTLAVCTSNGQSTNQSIKSWYLVSILYNITLCDILFSIEVPNAYLFL